MYQDSRVKLLLGLVLVLVSITTANSRSRDVAQLQWRQTSGPEGGRINAFLSDEINLYAGTYRGGVYRSNNNGESWTAANAGLADQSVFSLAMIGTNLFAGTNSGVYRSTNNAGNWTAVNEGLPTSFPDINSLAVIGTNLFAAHFSGVFRSTNNGESWAMASTGLMARSIRSLAVSGTNLFAGTQLGGVFRSTNNGESWTPVNMGLPPNKEISALFASGTNIYAGVGGFLEDGAVYRSTDQGQSWTLVGSVFPKERVASLAVSGTSLLAGTFGGGVFRLAENGESWVESNSGLRHGVVFALAVKETDIFAGTQGGVFRSNDISRNWIEADLGLKSTSVCSLAANGTGVFAATNETVLVLAVFGSPKANEKMTIKQRNSPGELPMIVSTIASPDRIFRSNNRGGSWTPFSSGLPREEISSLAVSGTNLFAGTEGGGILRSADNGESWTPVNAGLPLNAEISTLLASGTRLFAGVGGFLDIGAVYRSSNQGESWTAVGSGLPQARVTSLVVSGTSLFAGTLGKGIFRLTNNDEIWRAVNGGLPIFAAISSLVVNGTNIFAGTSLDGVFRSTDNGESWTPVNAGLTSPVINAFVLSGTNLYVGTATGVFRSINQGESWEAVNAELTNKNICSLVMSGPNLFAGTEGGGAYMSDPIAGTVSSVSAASFEGAELASESIAAAFGAGLGTTTATAFTTPLPTTLAGTQVMVRDSLGTEQPASLFFVSPSQVNYQVPTGLVNGVASVSMTSGDGKVSLGPISLATVAPGLFTANANGLGVAAALVFRIKADGSQGYEPVARFDAGENKFVAVPINLGPDGDQVFLTLYGTGFRFRSDISAVKAKIGGIDAPVIYAGAQGDFVALDQINLQLPRSLAERGGVVIEITVDGKRTNAVSVSIQ